jgi:hypothetical protein
LSSGGTYQIPIPKGKTTFGGQLELNGSSANESVFLANNQGLNGLTCGAMEK